MSKYIEACPNYDCHVEHWRYERQRAEFRPATEADLLAAFNARKRKRRVKQVPGNPWMFIVDGKEDK